MCAAVDDKRNPFIEVLYGRGKETLTLLSAAGGSRGRTKERRRQMSMMTTCPEKKLNMENPAGWKIAGVTCSRCKGLMVSEEYGDFPARRCIQCGEVIDPVILQNRQRPVPIGIG
jgi:hypothetical protein